MPAEGLPIADDAVPAADQLNLPHAPSNTITMPTAPAGAAAFTGAGATGYAPACSAPTLNLQPDCNPLAVTAKGPL
jgi:hypothetical protein